MNEFIFRKYGNDGYEVIIKTDKHEHYKAAEEFARRLIDHAKPMTNADRIRAMSDVELRDLICSIQNLEGGVAQVTLDGYTWGLVDVEEWLGYEAEVKR